MKSYTLWTDSSELYDEDGKLISNNQMANLLSEYFNYSGESCQFCGKQDNFSFFDIEIDGQPLYSNNADFAIEYNGREISYKLAFIKEIILNATSEFDISLNNFKPNLTRNSETSYYIILSIILKHLVEYYEIELFDFDGEEILLDFLNNSLNVNLKSSEIERLTYSIESLHFDYRNIENNSSSSITEIFGEEITKYPINEVKCYFGKEYAECYSYIIGKLNSIFIPQGVEIDEYEEEDIEEQLNTIRNFTKSYSE
ncbi:hypothetical protein [Plebeiibacterium marinum]|uniref:Uncharacterized protein n=1 Tax=Plebeiibacterium marinum TaxID=2992111 RepID=A0AAE3SMM3_9BACT|nr:hypothetical protein [Plebeiobacterium marinum]MCW3807700.1 hypothetical protein [Plebeiobacterium marinum]